MIDAGHGGKDPGSIGRKSKEKDITLAVALQLGKFIEDNMPDMRVIYTRNTDVFVELQERAEVANKNKADLFISIHCNSACVRDKKLKHDVCHQEVHGAETYVMGIKNEKGKVDVAKRENASILLEDDYLKKYDGFDPNSDEAYIIFSMYQDAYLDQSLNLSAKIQKQYKERAGRTDKGVKRASLWVLWRTAMPSLLTEIGFITNPEEEKFLCSEKGQGYVASSIFRALREYKNEVEGTNTKYNDAIEKQLPYEAKDTVETAGVSEIAKKTSEKIKEFPKDSIKEIKKTTAESTDSSKLKNHTEPPVDTVKKEKESAKTSSQKETKDIRNVYKEKLGKTNKDSLKRSDSLSSKTIYKVQIASGSNKQNLNSEKFKGLDKMGEYLSDNIYKYTTGEFETEKEATKLQNELRKKGFPGAFVVAFRNGQRVPLR